MTDLLQNPTIIATIIGALTWLGHRLWGNASDELAQRISAAVSAMRSIMSTVIATAKPDATVDWIHGQLVGVAAIQLARIGIDPKNELVKALVDAAVTDALRTFVQLHPAPQTLHDGVHELLEDRKVGFAK